MSLFFSSFSADSDRCKSIHSALVKMLARNLQPVSMVEDESFKEFVHHLEPSYTIPSQEFLTSNLLPRQFEDVKAQVRSKLSEAANVCLTTDIWTSKTLVEYMGVTAHFIVGQRIDRALLDLRRLTASHSSENLSGELRKIISEWDITGKVTCIVTNLDPSIIEAVQMLGVTLSLCLAHTLNAIMKDGLECITEIREKCCNIVSYFHQSVIASQTLETSQSQENIPKHELQSSEMENNVIFIFKYWIILQRDWKFSYICVYILCGMLNG